MIVPSLIPQKQVHFVYV